MAQNFEGLKFTFSYNELINLSFEKKAFLDCDKLDLDPRDITTAMLIKITCQASNLK